IYSIKDIEECKKALIKRFHFDEGTAQKLAEIEFTKGSKDFTNMSAKVMRQIIPYLEQGYKYSEAMEKAGYKHSEESRTKEENQQRILKEKLDLLPKNSLRQPVVEKILNQMIHIVNEIIDPQRGWITPEERQNGTFRIHIEFARELKNTPKNRKKLYELNRKRAKENEDIAKKLNEMKIPPSRTNIIRYRLFYGNNKEKTNGTCLYSGKTFELREVFDDKIVDKDHIIPQSIYPDDSQGNLVLVYKSENKNKGNRTAYDYMFSKGEQEFEEYLQRIQEAFNNGVITPIQVQNLLTTLEHDPEVPPHSLVQIENKKGERYKIKVRNLDEKGFSARDMRETSYITREAKRILSEICREVVVSTGSITALLRRLWGYDEILPKWHVERLRQIGLSECIEKKVIRDENNQETYIETVKDWSKRDDHRHHAIDALVVACTTSGLIQRINTAHAQGQLKEMEAELSPEEVETAKISNRMTVLKKWLRQQRIFSPQVVKEHVDNILISYKPGKKVATWSKNKNIKGEFDKELPRTLTPRGALHDDSYYGKITLYKPLKKDIKNLRNDLDKMHLIAAEDKKSIFGDEKVQYYINKNDIVGLTKYLKETKKITHYTIFEPIQLYVKRYPIGEINKKDVDKKDNFLDEKLYEKLLQVFPQGAKSSDKIKSDISLCKNPLKKIIRGIRMRVSDAEGTDRYYPIHYDKEGCPITFVIPGNNHHVAIYKDSEGNLHEHVCTFWHAVERKKYGIPVIIQNPKEVHDDLKQANKKVSNFLLEKLPNPEWKYVMSMQQNEMFILNMSKNKVEEIIRDKKYQLLSPHLYRVQKLTQGDYTFRNHLATRVDDKNS
ncbi:MAG: type II CRISPR RNA-guided endonuclease Cas9, partial [Bacteroidia bacterium]|nr:type II CRISPR RNA-guided endonuclease Cas9 [Bacteroidia bacterium]